MWRDNVWRRGMMPKLDLIGLGWAGFQALRGTHASLGHEAGVDPKVAADQRGNGIGVALDVYTKAAIGKRAEAAEKLENSVFAAYWSGMEWKKLLGLSKLLKPWSGRRGSNPRRPAWEAGILPLNYSRSLLRHEHIKIPPPCPHRYPTTGSNLSL